MIKRLILLFVLLSFIIYSNGQKPVTILRCCDDKINNTSDINSCVTDHNYTLPNIYSKSKKKLLNEVPLFWKIKTIEILDCGPERVESVLSSAKYPSFLILENGTFQIFENKNIKLIASNKYCFISNTYVKYCTGEKLQTKIKKCCGPSAVFSETKQSCLPMNVTDYKINVGDNKILIDGFPNCDFSRFVNAGKLQKFENIFDNGSIILPDSEVIISKNDYCLEHVLENAVGPPSILTCNHHIPTTTSRSPKAPDISDDDIRWKLYPFALLLSAIFLAATLIAGATLPAVHHHALHWRCQTNHVACLFIGDVLLAATQLAGKNVHGGVCTTIAFLMHFFFLAAFFWLNTMCFNIWWTFRDLRPGTLEKRQERCRLRIYGVYAWGVPFLISMIAIILDNVHGPTYTFLRPRFGEKSCWFPGDLEILAYFYGPVGLLLIINLLLFAATARELTCGLWKRELVNSTTERAALGRVCMKLVIVMGVTWIADILSWIVGGPQYLWYITDLINALQGLFIFIVVACQPQVWSALKRLWCRRQSLAADITGNGNHHSSSSHGYGLPSESVTNHSVSNTTRSVPIETSC